MVDEINIDTNETFKMLKTLPIQPGLNTFCFNNAGKYEFELHGCHLYKDAKIIYNTDGEEENIKLTAVKHRITSVIKTSSEFKDFIVKVKIGDEEINQGPLKYFEVRNDGFFYRVSVHLKPNEIAVVYPLEETLWFDPPHAAVKGENDCRDVGTILIGHRGKIIKGSIVPAIADVDIIVERDDGVVYQMKTDNKGHYKFPAFNANYHYNIKANKSNYYLSDPDEHGIIKAHKMGEIVITIVDSKDKTPLQVRMSSACICSIDLFREI